MPRPPQSYANHRRWFPLYHFFALPLLLAHFVAQTVRAARAPSLASVWSAVIAAALVGGLVAARAMALIVQNRVIGLEMRLRLAGLLPPDLRVRIPELRPRHLIGLRFAGDAELPALVERCLSGELRTAEQIKREIREWRPDWQRA